ncbi:MAG: flavin reductase family protein [Thiohalocapsa sp.]|nr:flavin reductase family protein [Thiohalocapsa sp.]MCF7989874.1 flavin reductase family protein [Thiohalocapsa sp.]
MTSTDSPQHAGEDAGRHAGADPLTAGSQPLDPGTADAVDRVYHLYDPPLWLVTSAERAEPGSRRGGCIATFVARASIVRDRPRMLAGIARQHHTWRMIESSGAFCAHLLPRDALDLVWRFGLASGRDGDKFDAMEDHRSPLGNPLIRSALAWLDCRVESCMVSGDRSLYLAAVTGGGTLPPNRGAPTPGAPRPGAAMTVGDLIAGAPPDKRAELDRLYARDGQIDAEAMRRWRTTRA